MNFPEKEILALNTDEKTQQKVSDSVHIRNKSIDFAKALNRIVIKEKKETEVKSEYTNDNEESKKGLVEVEVKENFEINLERSSAIPLIFLNEKSINFPFI